MQAYCFIQDHDDFILDLVKRFLNIKSLKIDGYLGDVDHLLDEISTRWELKYLHLRNGVFTEKGLIEISRKMGASITLMSFDNIIDLTDARLLKVTMLFSGMKDLTVSEAKCIIRTMMEDVLTFYQLNRLSV